mmetsp:Transcript_148015/g.368927  ORF Transcript_148015/g.368927 Transcript_148015/m.368927 type:complete len:322 (+) Transcript_148015:313-1278(+)
MRRLHAFVQKLPPKGPQVLPLRMASRLWLRNIATGPLSIGKFALSWPAQRPLLLRCPPRSSMPRDFCCRLEQQKPSWEWDQLWVGLTILAMLQPKAASSCAASCAQTQRMTHSTAAHGREHRTVQYHSKRLIPGFGRWRRMNGITSTSLPYSWGLPTRQLEVACQDTRLSLQRQQLCPLQKPQLLIRSLYTILTLFRSPRFSTCFSQKQTVPGCSSSTIPNSPKPADLRLQSGRRNRAYQARWFVVCGTTCHCPKTSQLPWRAWSPFLRRPVSRQFFGSVFKEMRLSSCCRRSRTTLHSGRTSARRRRFASSHMSKEVCRC